jgi:hypothetical protein
MTTWLRSLGPTCCALLMSCNALVGVHDLAISSDDAGEQSEPDATVPFVETSDADGSPDVVPPPPKRDGRDDGSLEAEETGEIGGDQGADENESYEDVTVIGGDASYAVDGAASDGTSPSIDGGDADRLMDTGIDDGNHPGVEAGGPSDTGIEEGSSPTIEGGEAG